MKIVSDYPFAKVKVIRVSYTEFKVIERINELRKSNPVALYAMLKDGETPTPKTKIKYKLRIWAAKLLTWRRPEWMRKPYKN